MLEPLIGTWIGCKSSLNKRNVQAANKASPKNPNGVGAIIGANGDVHARMRRNVSHAFSATALRQQEPLLQRYADLFVSQLRRYSAEGPINIVQWYSKYILVNVLAAK